MCLKRCGGCMPSSLPRSIPRCSIESRPLKLLVLGRGKTGSLVAEVARERGHQVHSIAAARERRMRHGSPRSICIDFDVVIDFTTPHAVLANIEACLRARKGDGRRNHRLVWRDGSRSRSAVEKAGTGFVFGANFSYGVNLFFQIVQAAAPALAHGYHGHITETSSRPQERCAIRNCRSDAASAGAGIGNRASTSPPSARAMCTGTHTLELASSGDRIVLTHEAKSRRTFAEGAVLAAEWIVGQDRASTTSKIFSLSSELVGFLRGLSIFSHEIAWMRYCPCHSLQAGWKP